MPCNVSYHRTRRLRQTYGNRLHYHVALYHSIQPWRSTVNSVRRAHFAGSRSRAKCAATDSAARDDDLPELLAAARAAKERFKPGAITYSRKVFHSADQSLPRLLRILHLPPRSRRSRRAHHDARRSARGRPRRRKTGMHRGPLQSRRQAGTAFPRDARDAAPSRLQVDAALSGSHVRTGAARDQPAAASESRTAQRGVDRAPRRRFPQHGADARDHQRRPAGSRRGARQRSRQSSRPSACARSRKPASRMFPSRPAC